MKGKAILNMRIYKAPFQLAPKTEKWYIRRPDNKMASTMVLPKLSFCPPMFEYPTSPLSYMKRLPANEFEGAELW